jgi:phosphonate transport system substrate-binding protein
MEHIIGALLAFGIATSASTLALAQDILRISALPDEAPTELQRKFKPLAEYLSKETGMRMGFTLITDYAAVVEALATKKIGNYI